MGTLASLVQPASTFGSSAAPSLAVDPLPRGPAKNFAEKKRHRHFSSKLVIGGRPTWRICPKRLGGGRMAEEPDGGKRMAAMVSERTGMEREARAMYEEPCEEPPKCCSNPHVSIEKAQPLPPYSQPPQKNALQFREIK